MRRIPFWIAIPLAVVVAIVGCTSDKPTTPSVAVPDPIEARAPDIEKAIHDQKGKVVLVDCWATWCPPCVKRFPQLVETQRIYAEKGLACMGVCMDKYRAPEEYSRDRVLKFLKEMKAGFPNLIVVDPEADSAGAQESARRFLHDPIPGTVRSQRPPGLDERRAAALHGR